MFSPENGDDKNQQVDDFDAIKKKLNNSLSSYFSDDSSAKSTRSSPLCDDLQKIVSECVDVKDCNSALYSNEDVESNGIKSELVTSDISSDTVELMLDTVEPDVIEVDLDQDDFYDVVPDTPSPEIADNSELEMRCKELELKVLMFEGMFSDLKREINAGMAELQNKQLEDQKITQESVIEVSEQIKSVTKVINLHTKALKKVNEKFTSIESFGTQLDNTQVPEVSIDISGLEDVVQSKADRDELMAISNALNVFREGVNSTLESIDQGMQESVSQDDMISGIQNELDQLREELANKASEPITIPAMVTEPAIPSLDGIELIIVQKLSDLESATLKQLEQQVNSNGGVLTLDDLTLLMDHMTEKNIVTSFKKGRYIYFSLVN